MGFDAGGESSAITIGIEIAGRNFFVQTSCGRPVFEAFDDFNNSVE
jgi:hypothetical protein